MGSHWLFISKSMRERLRGFAKILSLVCGPCRRKCTNEVNCCNACSLYRLLISLQYLWMLEERRIEGGGRG